MVQKYGAAKDDVKVAMQAVRKAERTDKDALQLIRSMGLKSVRDLTLAQAMENKANPAAPANPKILDIQRANEEALYKQVVGYADLDKMNKNALKNKQGGIENGENI